MRWVAMFSRTGSEIVKLSQILGREPDLILTNKTDFSNSMIPKDKCTLISNTEESISKHLLTDDLITLHGYLRIIPENICNNFNIFNGHPGLITEYEELKGFNPQIRALNYDVVGSVIHEVTAGVDEGSVVLSKSIVNSCSTDECMYNTLAEVSLQLWVDFMKGRIC